VGVVSTALHPGVIGAPFPGLRAFEAEESLLFYGREAHVADLLERLGDSHFVAVTGTSGSGKSSLVRAGLRPALHRGYLVDATSRWRFTTMRPGGSPLDNMALALASCFDASKDELLKSLRTTSAGLAEAVARAGLGAGESLLIIADQFEELFRFDVSRAQQSDASLFVSQLLEAAEQRETSIYVVTTMRSEFLGRCSEFTGLAEAFNRSQYLVPRLTRDERREAIERPLRLVGTSPSPALVQQVLNDAGDDPDQLPVLQHVLLRTYREWERSGASGRIELAHYERVGAIERALDVHGNEILAELSEPAQKTASKLFRSLTVAQGGVALRRPRRMQLLYDIAGAATAEARREVDDIIGRFAHPNNSFVMLSSRELTPATVVDITHESLIRKWKKLEAWVREETRSAEWYADLSRDVVRYRSGEVGLWQDPELSGLQRRRAEEGWNEAWANQYRRDQDPEFSETVRFLGESTATQDRRLREAAEQRDRELKQAQALARARRNQYAVALSLLAVVGVAAVMLFFSYRTLNARTEEARRATEQYSKALADSEASRSAVTALEAEREKLKQSGTAANPVDQQRLAELTREIESARQQAKGSEDELTKLRNSQKQTDADRSGLLSRIDALQKERDQLRQQLNSYSVQQTPKASSSSAGDDRAATLQKQLDDERRTSASQAEEITRLRNENTTLRNAAATKGAAAATVPSLQELTKYYTDGVRMFELKDYMRASDFFTMAIGHHLLMKETPNQRLPEQVRLSGTRFVPYAPFSYSVAARFEAKQDCQSFREFLAQTASESAPPDVRRRVDAARKACR
jgi:hypothetical protein